MQLEGNVAIVTGASRGIGKAIAKLFAREGAKVVVAARSETEDPRLPGTIHGTVEEIVAEGGTAMAYRLDVRHEDAVQAMVGKVEDSYGPVDILVNNAAASYPASMADLPLKRWDIIMDVNLRGYFLCIKAVMPAMIQRGHGAVLNLTSRSGEMSGRAYDGGSTLAYGVSKAAIDKLTIGLAEELREHGIVVNALKPKVPVATEGTVTFFKGNVPESWGGPEDMAQAALYLVLQSPETRTGWVGFAEDLRDETGAW
jgi:citronellol/citronellal dehydrogenase